jgi:hypothetical protein
MSPLFTLRERAQMAAYDEEVAKKEAYEEEVINLEAAARDYMGELLELTSEEIEEVELTTVPFRTASGGDPKPRIVFEVDGIPFSVRREIENQGYPPSPILEVSKRTPGYSSVSFTRLENLAQLGRWMKANGFE